jgi:hypothetical protein
LRSNCAFLSRLEAWHHKNNVDYINKFQDDITYDINMGGWWIRRDSRAYTLAILLGFNLEDPFKKT